MKTIIFNYPALVVGGVEEYIHQMMRYGIEKNYKVIWLYQNKLRIANEYKEIVSKIISIQIDSKGYDIKLPINKEDEVVLVSFTPFEHVINLKIINKLRDYKIKSFLIIANTKGRYYFVEEYYFGLIRKLVYNKIKPWIKEWNENKEIYYFSKQQEEAFNQRYFLNKKNNNNIVPDVMKVSFSSKEILEQRAERKEFNIITISRFDFPHKNYLLGLIDDYALLKKKYSNIKLHIIGYGQDEHILKDKISHLENFIKKDIFLYGSVNGKKIDEIMQKMHLNISCAGSVSCGSRNAVLSLPARNFCGETCEVYGYLPKSAGMTTSIEPGLPAKKFIEEIINMSKEEYIEKCLESYNSYAARPVDPEFLFEELERRANNKSSWTNYSAMEKIYYWRDISYKLCIELKKILHIK